MKHAGKGGARSSGKGGRGGRERASNSPHPKHRHTLFPVSDESSATSGSKEVVAVPVPAPPLLTPLTSSSMTFSTPVSVPSMSLPVPKEELNLEAGQLRAKAKEILGKKEQSEFVHPPL